MSIKHLDNDSVTSDRPQLTTTTMVDKPIQRFKNVTNDLPKYTIIWIDENINDTEENLVIQEKLKSGINQIKAFNSLDAGVDYLTDVEKQTIVLIICNTYGCHIIPYIHEFTQLKAIYVHCLDKKISTNLSKNYDKVSIFVFCKFFRQSSERDTVGTKFYEAMLVFNIIRLDSHQHCNDKLDESSFTATSAMMFIPYSTSPECLQFISNTHIYT